MIEWAGVNTFRMMYKHNTPHGSISTVISQIEIIDLKNMRSIFLMDQRVHTMLIQIITELEQNGKLLITNKLGKRVIRHRVCNAW